MAMGSSGYLAAELQYRNHSSVDSFAMNIWTKIAEDIALGRVIVFPREAAGDMKGLQFPPWVCLKRRGKGAGLME